MSDQRSKAHDRGPGGPPAVAPAPIASGSVADDPARAISAAVHELKGPLQVLSMALHTLEQRVERGQPPDPRSLERVNRQIHRFSRILDDLGDVGRLATRRITRSNDTCDLRAALEPALAETPAGRRADVQILEPPGPVSVLGDGPRTERLVAALLDRALKLSRDGTPVVVRFLSPEADGGTGNAALCIAHQGEALDESERALLSQVVGPAYSRTARASWYDLSLALVAELAALQGGSLRREPPDAAPGAAETLTLSLPAADTPLPQ